MYLHSQRIYHHLGATLLTLPPICVHHLTFDSTPISGLLLANRTYPANHSRYFNRTHPKHIPYAPFHSIKHAFTHRTRHSLTHWRFTCSPTAHHIPHRFLGFKSSFHAHCAYNQILNIARNQ